MADQLPLLDSSGTEYKFGLYPIGTNFKDEPGVYAFVRNDSEAWTIVYIGETDSLKTRLTDQLKQHHRYQCAVVNEKATHLLARIVAGGDQARLDLETGLRQAYEPTCNKQ